MKYANVIHGARESMVAAFICNGLSELIDVGGLTSQQVDFLLDRATTFAKEIGIADVGDLIRGAVDKAVFNALQKAIEMLKPDEAAIEALRAVFVEAARENNGLPRGLR